MKDYKKGINQKEKTKLIKEYDKSSPLRKGFKKFENLLYLFVFAGLIDILNEILLYIEQGFLSNSQKLSLAFSFILIVYILITGNEAVKGSLSDYKGWLKEKDIKY